MCRERRTASDDQFLLVLVAALADAGRGVEQSLRSDAMWGAYSVGSVID